LEAALILRFDRAFSLLSPEEFVREILVETMRARAVLVGANFRFGHRQAGDVQLLRELGKAHGFAVETIPPVIVRGTIVSSSAIREALREGRVSRAARFLGRPFSLAGEVRPGTGQGRQLIVPTLNLATEQELLPKTGVYVTETRVGGRIYRSATNIGVRPTFDGRSLTIESHLFDFRQELRSGAMEVRFWKRLRDEQRFSGPEMLREQVMKDLYRARRFFIRLDHCRGMRQTA
jgi:riboflavin kinase / FMN adenylyltransferase